MSERKLKEGAATFYIYDENLHHRKDDPFILWLKSEGFTLESFGHGNCEHGIYVNINSKVYTWGMGGVSLSPIIGNHAIHIEEFKQIYGIFQRYSGFLCSIYTAEKQKEYDDFQAQLPILKARAEKAKEEYFAQKPSFEQWLDDVAESIISDPWYKEHRPDYTKQEILEEMEDKWLRNLLNMYYSEQEMPAHVALEWNTVTM